MGAPVSTSPVFNTYPETLRKQQPNQKFEGGFNLNNWLFGGNATKGMASGPATGAYQTDYLKNMLGRQTPMQNTGQSDQVRMQQDELAKRLGLVARGETPGAGEMAVNRQVGQATAAQTAQSLMARGAGAGMANRTAARNIADIGVSGAGQAAIAQMGDQASANAQLGQILGTTRAQDIGVAGANQAAEQDQQRMQLAALGQMLNVDVATLQQDLAKRGIDINDKGVLPGLLKTVGEGVLTYYTGGAYAAVKAAEAAKAANQGK